MNACVCVVVVVVYVCGCMCVCESQLCGLPFCLSICLSACLPLSVRYVSTAAVDWAHVTYTQRGPMSSAAHAQLQFVCIFFSDFLCSEWECELIDWPNVYEGQCSLSDCSCSCSSNCCCFNW